MYFNFVLGGIVPHPHFVNTPLILIYSMQDGYFCNTNLKSIKYTIEDYIISL